jgi:hypothetical protein
MKTYGTYFNTQNETLNEFYRFIEDHGYLYEPLDCFQADHINYDTNRTYHIPLTTKKGNPARKQAHAFICRLSSGRYELTMYIN